MKHFSLSLIFLLSSQWSASAQSFWQQMNNGLDVDTLVRTAIVRSNGEIFIGTSEGGYKSTDHGASWAALIPPGTIEVQSLAFDQNFVYAGTDKGLFRSSDDGVSWGLPNSGFPDSLVMAIVINDSGHVYGGTDVSGLFRSKDQGLNWSRVAGGLTSSDIVTLSNFGGGIVFVGTDGAGMYRSLDGGNTWTQTITGLTDLYIRAATVKKNGVLFAGTNNNGVFRSIDTGKTWSGANTNLTSPFVTALIAHPNGTLYAGTSGGGVFRSTDDGNNWSEINTGLTNLFVYAFAVDSSGYLFAGTVGGGMYRSVNPLTSVDISGGKVPLSYFLGQNYPNPFNPATKIQYATAEQAKVNLEIFNILGQGVSVLVEKSENSGIHSARFDAAELPGGVYFYRLEVRRIGTGEMLFTQVRKMMIIK